MIVIESTSPNLLGWRRANPANSGNVVEGCPALTGQSSVLLARRTSSTEDWEYAVERLTGAAQTLDAGTRSRARALCAAQLAALHFAVNDHPAGTAWARQALATASRVPSARLRHFLATIQATAEAHHDNPEIEQGAPI